ncbi:hypothetical protein [Paenibacillus darwinianus]|uniref:hypothetical protein n=1 Tax=Paenibacillus darwinianus TaxID=1380763 RepID=UPI000AFBE9CD|nr:hypothetical protein [Paenibacillus darwinianus]
MGILYEIVNCPKEEAARMVASIAAAMDMSDTKDAADDAEKAGGQGAAPYEPGED